MNKISFDNKKVLAGLHLGFWVIIFIIHTVLIIRFMSLPMSLMRGFLNIFPIIFLFYTNRWLINRYYEKGKYVLYGILILVIALGLTALRVKINLYFPLNQNALQINSIYGWTLGAVSTNMMVLLLSSVYQIILNRNAEEKRALALLNEQNEAQLQFLKAQINPHFLFHTSYQKPGNVIHQK